MPEADEAHATDEFVRLVTRNQRAIYWYILALLPNRHDADEVAQETNIVLWRKFKDFTLGTNFLAWACRVARFEVLRYCDKHKHDAPNFSDILDEAFQPELVSVIESAEQMSTQLDDCLGLLKDGDRELVRLRYSPGASIRSVASDVGRSSDAIYKAMARIHQALFDCLSRQFQEEER